MKSRLLECAAYRGRTRVNRSSVSTLSILEHRTCRYRNLGAPGEPDRVWKDPRPLRHARRFHSTGCETQIRGSRSSSCSDSAEPRVDQDGVCFTLKSRHPSGRCSMSARCHLPTSCRLQGWDCATAGLGQYSGLKRIRQFEHASIILTGNLAEIPR
jgi:hypothetical protein